MKITPVEFPAAHIANLKSEQLYTDSEVAAVALQQGMFEAMKTAEAGQEICNFVSDRIATALTFQKWHDGEIVAVNKKGKRYAIVGSWWLPRFVLRGVVREKRNGKGFNWLINGQANKNAEQVAHYAEQEAVDFPEFATIIAAHKAATEAACNRRCERIRKYVLVDSRTYQRVTAHELPISYAHLPLEAEYSGREAGQLIHTTPAGMRYVTADQVK